jgi:hypothetical protein
MDSLSDYEDALLIGDGAFMYSTIVQVLGSSMSWGALLLLSNLGSTLILSHRRARSYLFIYSIKIEVYVSNN